MRLPLGRVTYVTDSDLRRGPRPASPLPLGPRRSGRVLYPVRLSFASGLNRSGQKLCSPPLPHRACFYGGLASFFFPDSTLPRRVLYSVRLSFASKLSRSIRRRATRSLYVIFSAAPPAKILTASSNSRPQRDPARRAGGRGFGHTDCSALPRKTTPPPGLPTRPVASPRGSRKETSRGGAQPTRDKLPRGHRRVLSPTARLLLLRSLYERCVTTKARRRNIRAGGGDGGRDNETSQRG